MIQCENHITDFWDSGVKVIPHIGENYMPFHKELWTGCWTLVNVECLVKKMTMFLELSIMKWILLDEPSDIPW
jgi:hypothetical protein